MYEGQGKFPGSLDFVLGWWDSGCDKHFRSSMEPVVALPSNPVDELARLRALAVEKANLRNQLKYRILGQLATNGSLDKTALETQFIEKLSLYKLRKDALVADKDKVRITFSRQIALLFRSNLAANKSALLRPNSLSGKLLWPRLLRRRRG